MPETQLDPVTLLFAAGAGLLSFISPCVLPLVPAYLSYVTGLSATQLIEQRDRATRVRVLVQSLAFMTGLAIVFTLLGASATLLGRLLLQRLELLNRLGGLLVILLGLQMMGLLRIPFLYRVARVPHGAPPAAGGVVGALLLGAAFAAGWTPCVGPFLASLLTLASQEQTVGRGMLLLFVYALGLGLPFLGAGLALERALRLSQALRPRLQIIEVLSGGLLLLMGILLFSGRLTVLSATLIRLFGTGLAQ